MIFNKFPEVRFKQLRDYPPYVWFYLRRLLYLKWWSYRYADRFKGFTFLSASDSLHHIMDHKLSVIRFGDGEYGQLSGAGEYPPDSDWSQRASKKLIESMRQWMGLTDPRILIAHTPPDIIMATEKESEQKRMISSMHTEARLYLWRLLHKDQVYGHWGMFNPSHNTDFDYQHLFSFLSDKVVVIVTGGIEKLPKITFGKKILFVETGKHDAFERRERILSDVHALIEKESLKPETTLFMFSLGPTAGFMVKQLSDEGFIAWDTGHFFKFAQEHWLSYANSK